MAAAFENIFLVLMISQGVLSYVVDCDFDGSTDCVHHLFSLDWSWSSVSTSPLISHDHTNKSYSGTHLPRGSYFFWKNYCGTCQTSLFTAPFTVKVEACYFNVYYVLRGNVSADTPLGSITVVQTLGDRSVQAGSVNITQTNGPPQWRLASFPLQSDGVQVTLVQLVFDVADSTIGVAVDDISLTGSCYPSISDISRRNVDCDFEQPGICGYTQTRILPNATWTRRRGALPEGGPSRDHTPGSPGSYLYYDVTNNSGHSLSLLWTPVVSVNHGSCSLSFYYVIYGSRSNPDIAVRVVENGEFLDNYWSWWSKGLHGSDEEILNNTAKTWRRAEISYRFGNSMVYFVFQIETDPGGYIAIDDVKLSGSCVIPDDVTTTTIATAPTQGPPLATTPTRLTSVLKVTASPVNIVTGHTHNLTLVCDARAQSSTLTAVLLIQLAKVTSGGQSEPLVELLAGGQSPLYLDAGLLGRSRASGRLDTGQGAFLQVTVPSPGPADAGMYRCSMSFLGQGHEVKVVTEDKEVVNWSLEDLLREFDRLRETCGH